MIKCNAEWRLSRQAVEYHMREEQSPSMTEEAAKAVEVARAEGREKLQRLEAEVAELKAERMELQRKCVEAVAEGTEKESKLRGEVKGELQRLHDEVAEL